MSFKNEPLMDFASDGARRRLEQALRDVRHTLQLNIFAEVNGQKISVGEEVRGFNPSNREEQISTCVFADVDGVNHVVESAQAGAKAWALTPVERRAELLLRAASLILQKRAELTALICLEVGKSLSEADAEISEAVDFLRYYSHLMLTRFAPVLTEELPGETNILEYRPRGLVLAITPWNFPLAIACGMISAPLVAGCPVIFKPAEQAVAVGRALYDILRAAGIPASVLHFLPGRGESLGAALAAHAGIHVVNFTGSRTVGLELIARTARPAPGQRHIKRVVAEMGGKNALFVDADADLDEALVASVSSAFGFAGQKCSALSRLIVHEACYEKFLDRLCEMVMALEVGPAHEPGCQVGPVIDESARQRLEAVILRHTSKIRVQRRMDAKLSTQGHFIPPTVFTETDAQSELMQEEFFGPLLTVFKVHSLEEAIERHNDVDYALTSGIFSRQPSHITRARQSFEAGNIYINREITGAIVGRQPFGGFKQSGVGAKAGGPDYLLQFLESVTVSENILRHGFVPNKKPHQRG